MASKAEISDIRTLDSGSITAVYAAVGLPFEEPIRSIHITNNTQGDLYFSYTSIDKIFVKSGGFVVYDIQANKSNKDDKYVLEKNLQFFVRQITAPVSGAVYMTAIF